MSTFVCDLRRNAPETADTEPRASARAMLRLRVPIGTLKRSHVRRSTVFAAAVICPLLASSGPAFSGEGDSGFIVGWGSRAVADLSQDFIAIAAGGNHSLALRADGSVVAWGDNLHGETNVPAPNAGFIAVAGGINHSLGLKADGSIVAWGSGETNVPAPNAGFIAIAAGAAHSLGLKADGSIVAWGANARSD